MRHHKGKLRAFGDYFCDWEWGFNEASLIASIRMVYSFSKYFWNVGMCSLLRSQDYIYYLFVDISIFPNEITFLHVAHAPKADQSSCDNLRSARLHTGVCYQAQEPSQEHFEVHPKRLLLNFVENFRESSNSSSWKEAYRETAPCFQDYVFCWFLGNSREKALKRDIIQKPSAT